MGPAARRQRLTRRLGLRARVTAAFALGALLLSVLLSVATFGLVRGNLVAVREDRATTQMYSNARILRENLRAATPNVNPLTAENLVHPGGGSPVLRYQGEWYQLAGGRSSAELPPELTEAVLGGEAAKMRFRVPGSTQMFFAVGVPIPLVDAAYFEITPFLELDGAPRQLAVALTAASIVTTLAGAAIGASASRRVLRPLANVSAAAGAIAGGRLDTRLARIDDPDFGTLVTSFNDMATALQERIERDARFASDVSHELRSPLTTLTASIEVLRGRREEMPPRAQFALDLMIADVQRFNTMVEDLLEISRFDAGAARLDLDEVRIDELLRHAVQAATDREVPLHVSPQAVSSLVQVDKRRLVRVLANLLINADKYAGGATAVSVERQDDDVLIAVEDEGPGIAPEDRERVFERFSRAAAAAGQRGTSDGVGLGLALVREHVALHGGRVWIEDRPDGRSGARFVVQLPATATDEEPVEMDDLGDATVPAEELMT